MNSEDVMRVNETIVSVLSELVTTERSYCGSLFVFSEVVAKTVCTKTAVSLKDLRLLFPRSLPEIYALHVEMLQLMEVGMVQFSKQNRFTDTSNYTSVESDSPLLPYEVLLSFLQKRHQHGRTTETVLSNLYTQYLDEFTWAMKTLQRLWSQSSRFRHTVKKLRSHPECDGFDFSAFLLAPVQRLPRYLLLIKQLTRQFEKLLQPNISPDKQSVQTALSVSRQVEAMLHVILVKLDTQISAYLHYPTQNPTEEKKPEQQPRDETFQSSTVKRNKSNLDKFTRNRDTDKKTRKTGIWPRVRRAFSEKRTEGHESLVQSAENLNSHSGGKDHGDMESTDKFREPLDQNGQSLVSDGGYNLTCGHGDSTIDFAQLNDFPGKLNPSVELSPTSPKHHITNQMHMKSYHGHITLDDSNGINLVSSNTQTSPQLSWVANQSKFKEAGPENSVFQRFEKYVGNQIEQPFGVQSPAMDSHENTAKRNLDGSGSITDSGVRSQSVNKLSAVSTESNDVHTRIVDGKPIYNTVQPHNALSRGRASTVSCTDFEFYQKTEATDPIHASLPCQRKSIKTNSTIDQAAIKHGCNTRTLQKTNDARRFSICNLFRWRTDKRNKRQENPLVMNVMSTRDRILESGSTNRLKTGKTAKLGNPSASKTESDVHSPFDHRFLCFSTKAQSVRCNRRALDEQEEDESSLSVDYSETDSTDVFVDETGNVCFAV